VSVTSLQKQISEGLDLCETGIDPACLAVVTQ
jgi:hypothetical protein